MNIYFNSPIITSLDSLKVHLQFSMNHLAISKIALTIFAVFVIFSIRYTFDYLREKVTVIDTDGHSYSTHMCNVNGVFKHVAYNGFRASKAMAVGEFLEGQLHGSGQIFFPESYAVKQERGRFEKGWLIEGTMIYADGKEEAGFFKNGVLNGQGVRKHIDGSVEKGNFNNGRFCEQID